LREFRRTVTDFVGAGFKQFPLVAVTVSNADRTFWRTMLRSAVFSIDFREPGTSEKDSHENTIPAAVLSRAPNRAKPLESQPHVPLASFP
jgi:hypothetical protein